MHFTGDLLLMLCSGQYEVVADPIPDDARVISVGVSGDHQRAILFVESREFKSGDFDTPLPPPTIRRIDNPTISYEGEQEC